MFDVHCSIFSKWRCTSIVLLLLITGFVNSLVIAQTKKPVVIPGKTFLPLRVLARPFSSLYDKPEGNIIEENVPAFQSYIVYTRPDMSITVTNVSGWYEVGNDVRGTVVGWMKAEDLMEWKQTMCLAYNHPGGRNPVLLFKELGPLRELLKSSPQKRASITEGYYQKITARDIPPDFPAISVEPHDFIDIVEQFYLLPILEHSSINVGEIEGRLLKVAAATKTERGGATLHSPEAFSANPEAEVLKKLQMDIVYVVDMTASMQPYIDATLGVIKNMTLELTRKPDLADSVQFGLWGYRDTNRFVPKNPKFDFLSKNFTPTLQNITEFETTLASVKTRGGGDIPEDMFSGIDDAMRKTAWTDNALRILVLLGDAPSHKPGKKRNTSGQSANTLRNFANPPNNLYIYALHIKDPRARKFWELTEEQFRTLSRNPGVETASYWAVMSDDYKGFHTASKAIAGELVHLVELAKAGKMSAIQKASSGKTDDIASSVFKMGHAALVQWLGREKGVKAPNDVIAWITDKDLVDPDIQALDVKILVSKNELDSLKVVLQEIITAGRRGIIGGEDFFTALQAIPGVLARTGDQIKNAQTIAESGLLPEFMFDLPYRSRVMNMSNEIWASWSVDQQEEFLNEIDAKIKLYAAIHDNPEGWVALNEGDDPSDNVHPMSLEALP